MLLVETILNTYDWSTVEWEALYTDLPSRQLKVKVNVPSRQFKVKVNVPNRQLKVKVNMSNTMYGHVNIPSRLGKNS